MRHALLLILCAFAAAPVAGQGPEWGFGYQGIVFDEGDRYDLGAFTVRGGYDFRSYLGIEAEVGIGVRGGAVGYYDMAGLPPMFEDGFVLPLTIVPEPMEVRLQYSASLFAVGKWAASDRLTLHARVGATSLHRQFEAPVYGDYGAEYFEDVPPEGFEGGGPDGFGDFYDDVLFDDGWGFEAATEMDSGLAYGIGAAVRVIDRLNVRLDAGGLVVRGQHRPSLTLTLGGGF